MSSWQTIIDFIARWYWIPLTLMYVGVIVTIIFENRNPSKSLAYILVIVFLPILGLIIYYLVGKKPAFKRPVLKRKSVFDRQKLAQYFDELRPQMEQQLHYLETVIGDMSYPFRYLYNQKQSLISTGNKVTLLNNGEEKFPALFKALENARSHIHIEYYILTADDVGNRLADMLIKKKKKGWK